MKRLAAVLLATLTLLSGDVAADSKKPAAAPKAQKVCFDTKTGVISARASCPKGQTQLTAATLAGLVQTTKGEKGEQGAKGDKGDKGDAGTSGFKVALSPDSEADAVVKAGTEVVIFPGPPPTTTIIAGVLSRTATCADTSILIAASCVGGEGNQNITKDSVEAADGKSVTCSWSNGTLVDITGKFFAKAVCVEL